MRGCWTSFDDFTVGSYYPLLAVGGVISFDLF